MACGNTSASDRYERQWQTFEYLVKVGKPRVGIDLFNFYIYMKNPEAGRTTSLSISSSNPTWIRRRPPSTCREIPHDVYLIREVLAPPSLTGLCYW